MCHFITDPLIFKSIFLRKFLNKTSDKWCFAIFVRIVRFCALFQQKFHEFIVASHRAHLQGGILQRFWLEIYVDILLFQQVLNNRTITYVNLFNFFIRSVLKGRWNRRFLSFQIWSWNSSWISRSKVSAKDPYHFCVLLKIFNSS